jgi:hypothetical protein
MQPPTRSRARRVLFPIALSVLGFGFVPIGTVSPNEPPAAVQPAHFASGMMEHARSERRLEKDTRVFFVLLIIADQLQAGRR